MTFNHSVASETSPDIEYSDDLAESEIEIEKTEVVKKFIFKTKAFYLQLDTGETETPGKEIAVDETENEDRMEVPGDDVEHGQGETDSRTSGRKK